MADMLERRMILGDNVGVQWTSMWGLWLDSAHT